ncbi:hypothetical protein [Flammeovirga pacifica]|uniref:Uncharacterized protein n=1 Tax=Flammeovirga pacifica TaxID=915059 RepID=A0A1S1Z0S7_FLAPC|nr:hypothetical protein [Flammeovirga pacifica]OHX66705.1 hypothetical protein NH26_10230 [Flammeovirga pacifica]
MHTFTFHKYPALLLTLLAILIGCEQPIDPVIDQVSSIESTLHAHKWYLNNFQIETKNDDVPPPVLWNTSQFKTAQGNYDSNDMPFDVIDNSTHEFTPKREILKASEFNNFISEEIGNYFIINDRTIRISNDAIKLNYKYNYNPELQHFTLTVNENDASKLIEKANNKLVKYAANRTPEKIGGLITTLLYHNKTIQGIINDAIANWLSGKAEFIDTLSPEETAQYLSEELFKYLESLQIDQKISEIVKQELDKILDFDADKVSQNISIKIANLVEQQLSTDQLYQLLLPYTEQIATSPEESAQVISNGILQLIGNILSEENINALVENAWNSFGEIQEEDIQSIAHSFTQVIEDNWVNEENIYSILLPFVQKIEDTSILNMGSLANEATEAIKGVVDRVNDIFKEVNLNPDYDKISSTLKTSFIAAKPIISLNGGAEKTTSQISTLIKNEFLSEQFIQSTIVSGIKGLQNIPAETVAPKVTALITTIGQYVAPEVQEFIASKLTLLLMDVDAGYLSFKIAKTLNSTLTQLLSEENVYSILFPLMVEINSINTKKIGDFIAAKVMDLDIIQENINHENISQLIANVLTNAQNIGSENIVQGIIDAVINTGIFESTITEDRVTLVISLILYNSAYQDVKVANNFSSVSIVLEHQ